MQAEGDRNIVPAKGEDRIMTGYSAEIRPENGRPALFVDGEEIPPLIYGLSDIEAWRSWKPDVQKNIRNFARQGFRIVLTDSELRHCWGEDNRLSTLEPVLADIRGVLAAQPDAMILMRLHVNAPRRWTLEHPDDICVFGDTPWTDDRKEENVRLIANDCPANMRVSTASEAWRRDGGRVLRELCERLAPTPEGKHLIGIQIAGALQGEWHQWGSLEHEPDYSPAMRTQFRRYLRERYRTDSALQQAWRDPAVTLDSAEIPPWRERYECDNGCFRDPRKRRAVIDSLHCLQSSIPSAILHFCGIVKKFWPRKIITGAFYGYFFDLFGNHAVIAGHLEAHLLYDAPEVDFLCGPFPYLSNRPIEGFGFTRAFSETMRQHGILFLTEMDQHPIGTEKSMIGGDPAFHGETIALLKRNLMEALTRGAGTWFYDHRIVPDGSLTEKFGWWDHPRLLAEIRKIRALFDRYGTGPYRHAADVAMVYDTEAYYLLADNPLADTGEEIRLPAGISHSGAAFDCLYLRDLAITDWSQYRCVCFVNTVFVTPEQRDFIRRHIATQHRNLVFFFDAGFCGETGFDPHAVERLTGIRMKEAAMEHAWRVGGCGLPQAAVKTDRNYAPLFIPDDPEMETAAVFQSGATAAGRKRFAEYTSWYFSLPFENPAVWRELFRDAGVHLYEEDGDALLAGGGIIAVTTVTGGERNIRLKNGKTVPVQLAPRSTCILDAETGETVG